MADERRYFPDGLYVLDRRHPDTVVGRMISKTLARRTANALNVYRIRPRKRAEKPAVIRGSESR